MCCPPYVAAAGMIVLFAYLSDRYYRRMPFAAACLVIVMAGFGALVIGCASSGSGSGLSGRIGATMAAITIACVGLYPALPLMTSWTANNLAPAGRRAVGVAFLNSVAACAGIFGSFLFQLDEDGAGDLEDQRVYARGFIIGFVLIGTALLAVAVLEVSYVKANARKMREEGDCRVKYSEDQLLRMGERSPLFKYTL
jgi:MFS family permease